MAHILEYDLMVTEQETYRSRNVRAGSGPGGARVPKNGVLLKKWGTNSTPFLR